MGELNRFALATLLLFGACLLRAQESQNRVAQDVPGKAK